MKTVQGSGVPGQPSESSTPSAPAPEARVLALLETIEVGIRELNARMDALERRVADLNAKTVPSEELHKAPPSPRIPPFAVRSDGKVLLSVGHLAGCDLSARERWEGVVLSEAETGGSLAHLSDLFDDAAGRTAGLLLWKAKKSEGEPEGGSSP